MYHKLFINHTEIALSPTLLAGFKKAPDFENVAELYDFVSHKNKSEETGKFCVIDSENLLWKKILSYHKLIRAAGGVVQNKNGELLVIHRLGFWDLPKGKMENDETERESALREVEEECGISQLEIVRQLPDTFHTYAIKGEPILKQTFWFEMAYSGEEKLIPQTEEGIEKVEFMSREEVENVALKNTYASLVPLFESYLLRNK